MSVGRNLQEMENVVTKGAKSAEPMPKLTTGIPDGQSSGGWEDLGGPTPENYKTDDESAKLKTPGATLAQVRNVVNKGAKSADSMGSVKNAVKEESEDDEENFIDEEQDEEEIVDYEEEGDDDEEDGGGDEEEEEEEEVEEEFDIDEDVSALLEGEDLSEEFQEKARLIFESAIRSKVSEIKEQLVEEYESALVEEIQTIKEELTDRVDAYLEYVCDEWIFENALAIEHGLKAEMTESFLQGMKGLFENHYVSIPEDRYDVIESMVDKLDEMEEKLNEQIERNVALNRRLAESVADVIFSEVSEGLALSQKDKLASLAENVEFDCEDNYREKLVTLRESYFPENTGTQRETIENLTEGYQLTEEPEVNNIMESYLKVLSRGVSKN